MTRVGPDGARGAAVAIIVDGVPLPCFAGETVAAAMLAGGRDRFRDDSAGRPRGLFCNMGTCCACLVDLPDEGRRVRACLIEVRDGLKVATRG